MEDNHLSKAVQMEDNNHQPKKTAKVENNNHLSKEVQMEDNHLSKE